MLIKARMLAISITLVLLASTLYLGYENNLLRAENSKLCSNLEDLREIYSSLEEECKLLNATLQAVMIDYEASSTKYYELEHNYTMLQSEYRQIFSKYVELNFAYAVLNNTYQLLLKNFTMIQDKVAQYEAIVGCYEQLAVNYTLLKSEYGRILQEYEQLYKALYEPLTREEKKTPTINELKEWLAQDKTNELAYSVPDFVCGDFAVMLHMHAKMKGWDMGIVVVIGRLMPSGKEFRHAFNAILCQEGLVYVEPQRDEVFYGPIIVGGVYYHPGFGLVRVYDFIVVVLYDGDS